MKLEIWQVDAFTDAPLTGNPAAVVFGGEQLDTDRMQAISREMNLSETAFVTEERDQGGGYTVRFFTPRHEVAFGGHPTVAAACAVLRRAGRLGEGKPARVVQRCGIGDVPVDVTWRAGAAVFTMRQGAPVVEDVGITKADVATLLGCSPEALGATEPACASTGMRWLVVPMASRAALDAVDPDMTALARASSDLRVSGITAFAGEPLTTLEPDAAPSMAVRSFAPLHGVPEDPVCGSGNGAVAAYLMIRVHPYVQRVAYRATQGAHVQRPGLVHVEAERGSNGAVVVRVGGGAVRVMTGVLDL
jgi:PhzF family phenazine biosynthesis protein